MLPSKPIANQVLESLARNPACEFKQLVADCPEFTWNQLFYEVDWLSQLGQLSLTSVRRSLLHQSPPIHRGDHEAWTATTLLTKQRNRSSRSCSPRWRAGPVGPVDRHVWIAQRAYQLYEAQGRRDGLALEHWLQAEGEFPLY